MRHRLEDMTSFVVLEYLEGRENLRWNQLDWYRSQGYGDRANGANKIMIMTIIFILTMLIVILNTIKFIGMIVNNIVYIPLDGTYYGILQWYLFFPSFGFQIWFWFTHYGII